MKVRRGFAEVLQIVNLHMIQVIQKFTIFQNEHTFEDTNLKKYKWRPKMEIHSEAKPQKYSWTQKTTSTAGGRKNKIQLEAKNPNTTRGQETKILLEARKTKYKWRPCTEKQLEAKIKDTARNLAERRHCRRGAKLIIQQSRNTAGAARPFVG